MSPAYVAPPYAKRSYLVPGIIGFSFGSFNEQEPPTKMQVTSVAMTGGTATLGVTILEGDAPLVGSLISVRGTQTGAGEFNVTNVALTAVSFTGASGTVQFALVGTVSTTPDAGIAVVPQPVVPENVASGNKGQQFAVQSHPGGNKQHGISWFTEFTGGPSAVVYHLQGADRDVDADYTTFDTSVNSAGESRSIGNLSYNFYRVTCENMTGGSGAAAGIVIS
jgi:hypothetical protein